MPSISTMTKNSKGSRAASAETLHGALPKNACPQCGYMMEQRRGSLRHPVHGERVEVPDIQHLGCPRCGEVVLSPERANAWRKAAMQHYRDKHGLLSAGEIRALRERLGLSQAELAALLRLDSNMIARWESDRLAQTTAFDVLLRMVRDLPGTLGYLRMRAA